MRLPRILVAAGAAVLILGGSAGSARSRARAPEPRLPSPARQAAGQKWCVLPPLPETSTSDSLGIGEPLHDPSSTFSEALAKVRDAYYGSRVSERELTYAAVRGLLGALGDRYTRFLDPEEWRRMQEDSGGEFGGVGIGIRMNARHQAEVASVTPGGSAHRAGVRVGDILLKVDQVALATSPSIASSAQDLVRGPSGTPVRLTLRRPSTGRTYSVRLVRRTIQVPTVHARMAPKGVGILTVESFGKHTDEEIAQAWTRLRKQGLRALVLDLRGNPGGLFESAIEVSSRFVPPGTVVFTQDRDGRRMHIDSMPNRRLQPKVPLAVLIDQGSASASEIVAGAIKDTQAGILVGSPTYGKAVVQTITPLKDGSAVLVTTHHYYTPKGHDIGSRGVEPHYRVGPSTSKDRDPALHQAVSLLAARVAAAERQAGTGARRAGRTQRAKARLAS